MEHPDTREPLDLQAFIAELGAALNAVGEPVYTVQERLSRVATAYGMQSARITAFPTFMMVSMGRGEPATIEISTTFSPTPRLDQIAALDNLVERAERGEVPPPEGLQMLDEIREMRPRFGRVKSIVGYSVFSLGLCLILHPSPSDIAAAAVLGALVGWLRSIAWRQSPIQVLMPVIAAFVVSALSALAVREGLTGTGLRAMVASLVVFLPGATLTTSVLELAEGQMISGASRLVSGVMQLTLLAFGIVAGIGAVGVPTKEVFSSSRNLLGDWAPSLGVLVFAVGVMVANSAPTRSFPGLLIVLYVAWAGQVVGNAIFGGYVSALVGAMVMTPTAFWVSRLPSAMPPIASFLPGFWLLVPGAIGLIGLAKLAGNGAGTQDLIATAVSIFGVAVGVLCGTIILEAVSATRKVAGPFADRRFRWRR